jgi:hypothetical protein
MMPACIVNAVRRTDEMTPDQILLVQTSFHMAGADGAALARTLTARLERYAPTPHGSAEAASVHVLARLLVLGVRGLTRRRMLRPALRRVSVRHPAEGTTWDDALVARALVEALEDVLGGALPRAAADA